MDYEKIKVVLAPCGLNCSKCMAFDEGDIKTHSRGLKEALGNFDNYAKRFSGFWPVFAHYPEFKQVLEQFTQGNCRGCRSGDCKYPNCGVAACYKEKQVDFCFQCDEFPCDKSNLDDNLKERWIKMNMRMKEIGVEAYYREIRNTPRYL